MLADSEPLSDAEAGVLVEDGFDAPEPGAPVSEPPDVGAPEVVPAVEAPPVPDITDTAGALGAVEAPGFGAIGEPEMIVLVGATKPEPVEPDAPGTFEAAELADPECRALRYETSEDVALLDIGDPPAVAEAAEVGLTSEPDADDLAIGALGAAEFPDPVEGPEPGAPMLSTEVTTDVGGPETGEPPEGLAGAPMLLTEVTTDVGGPETGEPPEEELAGAEAAAELGDPEPAVEVLPPTAAVERIVCTEVSVESGELPGEEGAGFGLLGLLATTDVAGGFPGELLPPTDVTTVTKEGEADPGPAEGSGGATGPDDPGPLALGPPTVKTEVEVVFSHALEGPPPGAPMVVAVVT